MLRHWKKSTKVLAATVFLAGLYILRLEMSGAFDYSLIKVPKAHDARLLGSWKGTWVFVDETRTRSKVTVFRADGTGEWSDNDREAKPFEWGTEDGILYTRRMAVDYWEGSNHKYAVAGDGETVWFSGLRLLDLVCGQMQSK